MEHLTDIIILTFFLLFFINGWRKGLLRTLLGPLALIIGGIAGVIYYQQTQDLLMCLIISIVGPFVLNILFNIIHHFWQKSVEVDAPFFSWGRLFGGVFSLLWSGIILLLTLLFIVITPGNFPMLKEAQQNISQSKTYHYLNKAFGEKLPLQVSDVEKVADVMENPQTLRKLRRTQEFKDVMENPKVKDLLEDEATLKQIQEKKIFELLSNKKMKAIFEDGDLVKKLFALNQKVLEENAKTAQEPEEASEKPAEE